MDYGKFKKSPSGTLTPTLYGEFAFIPHRLPPNINFAELAIPLSNAASSIGELKGACRKLANPYILMRPLQRREALTSSAMEGTHTTNDELVLAEAGLQRKPSDETREVANYTKALSEALEKIETNPITNRLLRDAHRTMLSNVSRERGARKLPGEFKRDQNMIGGRTLDAARFIPPPPHEAVEYMSDMEKYINRQKEAQYHPIIDMALVHYQFETIHPFADGNGRVGRMLISLMAVHDGLLEIPALYLSPVIERRKDEYIDLMYAVSATGAWDNWLLFFFDVVQTSCAETISTIDRIILLQERYKNEAGAAVNSSNILLIIDMLFETPAVTVRDVVERLAISDVAARKLLSRLCDLEILYEYNGIYPKVFLAMELITAASPPR